MPSKDNIVVEEVENLEFPVAGSIQSKIPAPGFSTSGVPQTLYEIYKKKKFRMLREAKQRMKTILLESDTWNVLWQIDGKNSVESIASNLAMPVEEVIYHTESLRMIGIICAVDAIYLPDFIQEKTNKAGGNQLRRKGDADIEPDDVTELDYTQL